MRSTNPVLRDLDTEWDCIAHRLTHRQRVTAWTGTDTRLAGLDTPQAIVDVIKHGDRSIDVTRATLVLAASDPLARRILLQTLVPAMATAIRTLHRDRSTIDLEATVIAAAVGAINKYAGQERRWPIHDLQRRLRRVALIACRAEERWAEHTITMENCHALNIEPGPDSSERAVRTVLDALADHAELTDSERDTMWHTITGTATIASTGLSASTNRRHRQHLRGRLADAADALL